MTSDSESQQVKEFQKVIGEMGTIKPPGVSGSRIKKLKEIFLSNVELEEELVPTLIGGCKDVPATNKLGPLYVVDAIIRGLIDEISKPNGSSVKYVDVAADSARGTAAAAINAIRGAILEIVKDATGSSNENVRDKIFKLIEIWQNCKTFDEATLKEMIETNFPSTTPPGSPPAVEKKVKFADSDVKEDGKASDSSDSSKAASSSASRSSSGGSAKDPASVLQALANLAKKTPSPGANAAGKSTGMGSNPGPGQTSGRPERREESQSSAAGQNMGGNQGSGSGSYGANASSSDPEAIFKMLQNMNNMGAPGAANGRGPQQYGRGGSGYGGEDSRGYNNNNSNSFGDPRRGGSMYRDDRYRDRDRGRDFDDRGRGGMYDRYGSRRRERSPQRGGMMGNPEADHTQGEQNVPSNPHYRKQHFTDDPNLAPGCIGVYSRTIFIGGVPHTMDQEQLAQILRPYAEVQSVILNNERRHAFVKVYSRAEAEQVLQAFSVTHPSGLRARWGVGFGPRDCCDYQTGVSTIPISRLTDADKRWVVSAQWGGTGGEPLRAGMFVEEPDIEVGHGVSSKSISRKMPTNSASNGPKSDLPGGHGRRENYGGRGYNRSWSGSPQGGMSPQMAGPAGFGGNPMGGSMNSMNPMNNMNSMNPMNNSAPPPPPPGQAAGNQSQAQMMATMMAAMQQMQQQGNGQVDMAQMLQNMAQMMRQNQH